MNVDHCRGERGVVGERPVEQPWERLEDLGSVPTMTNADARLQAWMDAETARREHADDFFVVLTYTGERMPTPKRAIDHAALAEFDAHEVSVTATRAAYYESVRPRT